MVGIRAGLRILGVLAACCGPAAAQVPGDGAGMSGVYSGSYMCQDGEHGFYLDISALARRDDVLAVSGRLGIFPVLGGAAGPLADIAGSFLVHGTIDGQGAIWLEIGDWLVQPPGYGAANLEGRLSKRRDGLWQIHGRPVLPGNEAFCSDLIATQFMPAEDG